VLLLDEPTTGLDVTTQAHILELLREIATKTHMALLYVSHDLGAIARVCDEVLVMYAGQAVLSGSAQTVLRSPSHPYAQGLLASIPKLNDPSLPDALEGRPPAPGQASSGCAFADRCFIAQDICRLEPPKVNTLSDGQKTRCHFPDQVKAITLKKVSAKKKFNFKNDGSTLSMNKMSIRYKNKGLMDQLLRRPHKEPATVDCINLSISKGETLGLVGESGSGKSTILKTIAGLLQPSGGTISLEDNSYLPTAVEYRSSDQLRRIQLVFQNPDDSLNPRHTVRQILEQPLKLYFNLTKKQIYEKSVQILEQVRLGSHYLDRLPSQLSGGEKQRIAIARAFVAEPDIVLCDEVTSALDVSVQAAVLELLDDLKQTQRTTYVFVSHDLAVVKALSDRVAVLYQGRLCEIGPTDQVYNKPSHPYTEVLLGAVLEPDPDHELKLMADDIVELAPPESGCPFQRRCPRIIGDICKSLEPPWQTLPTGNQICCHIPWQELNKTQAN
jgi:peptide/nickel transport system ATP-binding protein